MAQNTADPRDPASVAPGTGPLLFIVFIMVASTSTLWPILTPYAKDLGASGFQLGLVVSSIYFTRLVLGPWVGRIGDRRGYRGLLIAGTHSIVTGPAGTMNALEASEFYTRLK